MRLFPTPTPCPAVAAAVLLSLGLTERVVAENMKEKISGALAEDFQFDPEAPRGEVLDEDGVVLMAPVLVQEDALPSGLAAGVAEERLKLTPQFSLKDGGELIKDAFGRMTIEAKPHQDLIKTDIGSANPVPRWSILRIKW